MQKATRRRKACNIAGEKGLVDEEAFTKQFDTIVYVSQEDLA